jgi:hypothetical protein
MAMQQLAPGAQSSPSTGEVVSSAPARPRSERFDTGLPTCAIDGPTCAKTATTQNISSAKYRSIRSNPQPLTACIARTRLYPCRHAQIGTPNSFSLPYGLGTALTQIKRPARLLAIPTPPLLR